MQDLLWLPCKAAKRNHHTHPVPHDSLPPFSLYFFWASSFGSLPVLSVFSDAAFLGLWLVTLINSGLPSWTLPFFQCIISPPSLKVPFSIYSHHHVAQAVVVLFLAFFCLPWCPLLFCVLIPRQLAPTLVHLIKIILVNALKGGTRAAEGPASKLLLASSLPFSLNGCILLMIFQFWFHVLKYKI